MGQLEFTQFIESDENKGKWFTLKEIAEGIGVNVITARTNLKKIGRFKFNTKIEGNTMYVKSLGN